MDRPKIVVVGSSNTDMVIDSSTLPRPGETVLGGQFLMAAGGKGANQAVAAARAGAQVTFIGCVGDDHFGRQAVTGFRNEGINTDYVRVEQTCASGVALVMVDSGGENLISVAPGANARLSPRDVEKAAKVIAEADCLLTQLEVPLKTVHCALEIARKSGVLTILNPAPAHRLRRDFVRLADIITPNRTELTALLGHRGGRVNVRKLAESLRRRGVGSVVVTLGNKGALIVSESQESAPAFRVETVDSVGAGDVFNGTLAVARVECGEMTRAVRFACAAAAISVTRRGAQPSIPEREEIDAFLARHA